MTNANKEGAATRAEILALINATPVLLSLLYDLNLLPEQHEENTPNDECMLCIVGHFKHLADQQSTLERELEAVRVERDAAQVERDTQRDITDRENSRAIAAESQLAEARRDVGVLREALSGLLSAYRHSAPNTVFEAEKQLDRIRAAGEQARAALQSTAESAGKKEQG